MPAKLGTDGTKSVCLCCEAAALRGRSRFEFAEHQGRTHGSGKVRVYEKIVGIMIMVGIDFDLKLEHTGSSTLDRKRRRVDPVPAGEGAILWELWCPEGYQSQPGAYC